MKLLSKILFLYALVFALNACNDEPSVVFNENDIEKYENTLEKVASYFETKDSYDLSADCEYLKSLDDVTNVQQNDSLIEVTLKNGMIFTVDYYEQIDDFGVEDIDEDKLTAYIDSIDDATNSDRQSGYSLTKDVFADYISSNAGGSKKAPQKKSVANSPQKANKSTNSNTVKLTRRNAAIWAPLGGDYKEADDAIKKIANSVLSREGKEIKVLNGFSPSIFASFKDYDLVYMSYHGNKGGIISIPVKALNQKERNEYKEEYKYKRIEGRIKVKDKKKYIYQYDLTETFWQYYLAEANNTIIFSCVCYLGQQKSSFWEGCKSNVADFFGADDECRARSIIQIFQSFYPLFMRGNISTRGAFQRYTDGFMHNGVFYTFTYDRFGTKKVYYLTPHATGIVNSSNSSSQIVVKSQLLYSADESSDILNDIEAGVALKDMETNKVTLIPFSTDNIITDEKKEKDGRVTRNISISLSNLTEDHKYAYCTYTKIDGDTNLSEECYKFAIGQNYVLTLNLKNIQNYVHEYTYKEDGSFHSTSSSDLVFMGGAHKMTITKTNGNYEFDIWLPHRKRDLQDAVNAFEFILDSSNPYEFHENPNVSNDWGCYSYTNTSYIGWHDFKVVSFSQKGDVFSIDLLFMASATNTYTAHIQLTNIDTNPKASIKCDWNYTESSVFGYIRHIVYEYESTDFEYYYK